MRYSGVMAMTARSALLGKLAVLQGLDVGVEPLDFHLAVLSSLRQLGVAKQIDARIPPPEPGPQLAIAAALGLPEPKPGPSAGQCAEAMLLNLMSGRVALYQMAGWLQRLPCRLFWGADICAEQFTDDRLARTLDALHEAGLDSLYSEFFAQLVRVHDVPTDRVHSDGSTLSLQGAYELGEDCEGPIPRFGYSKNNHRGLQLVLGNTVQQHGIPVVSRLYDGNTSDQVIYRDHLARLADGLCKPEDTTFVGDCKVCDAETLGALRSRKFHVVTLLPKTFSAHRQLLERALSKGSPADWPLLLERTAKTSDEEPLVYRGVALSMRMPLQEIAIRKNGKKEVLKAWTQNWSAVVVHSSQLAEVHLSAQNKAIEKERKALQSELRPIEKMRFATREKAEGAREPCEARIGKRVDTWDVLFEVVEEKKKLPRGKPGRPRTGEAAPEGIEYRVKATLRADEEGRREAARHHGLFILVCSRKVNDQHSASHVLGIYREQTEVEAGFRWLKAPLQMTPVLLHTPTRIAALGLLFSMALGLYRTLQMRVRRALAQSGHFVVGHHNKPTQQPSLEFIMTKFQHLTHVLVRVESEQVGQTRNLREEHRELLRLLGLPDDLYDAPQTLHAL